MTAQSMTKPTSKPDSKPGAPAKDAPKAVRTKVGVVDSDKRSKTRRVVVKFQARHPKYGKYIASRTILHVHDENNESHTGDIVEIAECRPISKTKFWRLVRIVDRRAGQ
jgi:small subunit ribosomal protein S17